MNIRSLAAIAFTLLLLQGCSGKEKETEWGIFNEPVKREVLPEPVGAASSVCSPRAMAGHDSR